MKLNQQELADHIGVTAKSVSVWVKAGLPKEKNGKIDLDKALAWLRARDAQATQDPKTVAAFSHFKALQKKLSCERAQLELAKLKGELTSNADVIRDWTQMISACKQILLSLPARVASPFGELAPSIARHAGEIVHDALEQLAAGKFSRVDSGSTPDETNQGDADPALQVETVPISSLIQDPANVRLHNARNLEAIKNSLRRFGQVKPIVIDSNCVVRAGNGTLSAALSLGWEKIAVVRTTLTSSEATAFAIADNRSSELAEWDFEALGSQLKSLQDEQFDLTELGWEPHETEPLLAADWTPAVKEPMTPAEKANPPIKLDADQRQAFDATLAQVREQEGKQITEAECVVWLALEWREQKTR